MSSCIKDLDLEKLFVIYPGDKQYSLSNKVEVIPLEKFDQSLLKTTI